MRTRRCWRSTTSASSSTWRPRGPSGTRPGCRPSTAPIASSRTSSPTTRSHAACRSRVPAAVWARAGYFAYDTMTLIGPGTWEAARAAVDAALTAVDLVAGGAPHAYACCRPPGHHACRAALRRLVLPEQLSRRRPGARRARRAGRGARHRRAPRQRNAGDLLGAERRARRLGARRSRRRLVPALPRLRRRARRRSRRRREPERAGGAREAATSRGSTAVRLAVEWAANSAAEALVVPLGVDAAAADPESPLDVSAAALPRGRPDARRARTADGARAGRRLRPGDDRPAGARGSARDRADAVTAATLFGRPLPPGGTIGVAARGEPVRRALADRAGRRMVGGAGLPGEAGRRRVCPRRLRRRRREAAGSRPDGAVRGPRGRRRAVPAGRLRLGADDPVSSIST